MDSYVNRAMARSKAHVSCDPALPMATDPTAILTQLDSFIRKRFDVAPDDPEFSSDVHLFDHGYVDSFGAQEIIAFLESAYHIRIGDDDLVKYPLNTTNEIARFVVVRQAENA